MESVAKTRSVNSTARITGSKDPLAGWRRLDPFRDGGFGRSTLHHAPCSVEQKQAEYPIDPIETLQQRDAESNKEPSQQDRSGHAPDERGVLTLLADTETLEQDQENKKVIYAERGLDGVAGHKFESLLAAVSYEDPGSKDGGGQNHGRSAQPGKGLRVRGLAAMAGELPVGDQQKRDNSVKAHPPGKGNTRDHSWMLQHVGGLAGL